ARPPRQRLTLRSRGHAPASRACLSSQTLCLMTADPHWTTYLAALLTPTVAILGSFIAYRQWRLAQNKLKLDLFDRRYSVYKAAHSLLASIMTSGKAKDDDLYKFLLATREAKWLLDSSVA